MIDGRIAQGPIASFARIAKRVGAGARASAQLAPVAAAGGRARALTGVLGALAAPLRIARAVSGAAPGAGSYSADETRSRAGNRGVRESAAIATAARTAMPGAHAARVANRRTGPSQSPSLWRQTVARMMAASPVDPARALGAEPWRADAACRGRCEPNCHCARTGSCRRGGRAAARARAWLRCDAWAGKRRTPANRPRTSRRARRGDGAWSGRRRARAQRPASRGAYDHDSARAHPPRAGGLGDGSRGAPPRAAPRGRGARGHAHRRRCARDKKCSRADHN